MNWNVMYIFRFEIWQNVGGLSSVAEDSQNTNKSDVPGINFRFHRLVDIDNCDGKCLVGQVEQSLKYLTRKPLKMMYIFFGFVIILS
jgi:hypothetical protein